MTTSIRTTLKSRRATHGDFADNAVTSQALKEIVRTHSKTPLSPVMREALDMILHKIGRICSGDPTHKDHFVDIAGYATLVADTL